MDDCMSSPAPLESALSDDVRELTKELHERFNVATVQPPLILFLLEQLTDSDKGPIAVLDSLRSG